MAPSVDMQESNCPDTYLKCVQVFCDVDDSIWMVWTITRPCYTGEDELVNINKFGGYWKLIKGSERKLSI
ncbi:MAG: hypothetical protein V3T79_03850 [Candidatus Scalindua sediminis]